VEQYNIETKVNYRQALEKIHINTETQTKNNEVIIIIRRTITVIAYYKKLLM
jgi:hypothetical protein